MTVFELMKRLEKMPVGAEVQIQASFEGSLYFEITDLNYACAAGKDNEYVELGCMLYSKIQEPRKPRKSKKKVK
jgi:hypothetical protein